jgi:hypothetical protein
MCSDIGVRQLADQHYIFVELLSNQKFEIHPDVSQNFTKISVPYLSFSLQNNSYEKMACGFTH